MKKIIAVIAAAALLLTTAALAVAGTAGDPFVTLNYVNNTYLDQARQAMLDRAALGTAAAEDAALNVLDEWRGYFLVQAQGRQHAKTLSRMTLSAGSKLELFPGSGLLYEGGRVTLSLTGGVLVDVTDGSTLRAGGALKAGHRYLAAENVQCILTVVSDAAYVAVEGFYRLESTGTNATPFTDLTPADWYYSPVCFAYQKGLFNGTSDWVFSPNTNMNRAMLATVLSRLAGANTALAPSADFADVPADAWYAAGVNWAAHNGIVTGYEDNTYAPLRDVTREQMATMLYRYARNYLGRPVGAGGGLSSFPDGNKVSSWAKEAVIWATGNGILTGFDDGTLRPGGTATRAQVATMLQRFSALI